MLIGMLWFDNDPTAPLADKLNKAIDYYKNKHGAAPNLCFVNPGTPGTNNPQLPIQVRTSRAVLTNHFWLGVNSDKG